MEDIIPITPETVVEPGAGEELETPEEFEVKALEVHGSAVGSLKAGEAAVGTSALGVVSAGGEASVDSSFAGAVLAGGDIDMTQSASCDVLAKGDVHMHQAGTMVVLSGRDVSIEGGGAGMSASRTASVRSSWVGFLLSGRTELSEDSRVIVDAKAAAIFGLIFGGLVGLAIVGVAAFGWYRYRQWRATWPKLPHIPHVDLPHMPNIDLSRLREMDLRRLPWRRDAA